mmetsp:Transcript_9497/g.10014  ORF Transcript_9497/g.10014 Transcript_9497/m.10014 type:complete len:177 (-) Transcript_9497:47-577(-)
MSATKTILQRIRSNLLLKDTPWAFWSHPRAMDMPCASHGSYDLPAVTNRSENPYDTNKFKRDPNNLPSKDTVDVHTIYGDLRLQKHQPRGNSSKGQNIPAVFKYDPTGLRSTPTASWKALDAELQKYVPKHFPRTLATEEEYAQLIADSKAKGRPIPAGVTYKWKKVSDNFNQVRW